MQQLNPESSERVFPPEGDDLEHAPKPHSLKELKHVTKLAIVERIALIENVLALNSSEEADRVRNQLISEIEQGLQAIRASEVRYQEEQAYRDRHGEQFGRPVISTTTSTTATTATTTAIERTTLAQANRSEVSHCRVVLHEQAAANSEVDEKEISLEPPQSLTIPVQPKRRVRPNSSFRSSSLGSQGTQTRNDLLRNRSERLYQLVQNGTIDEAILSNYLHRFPIQKSAAAKVSRTHT
jgi:hypothetical protein